MLEYVENIHSFGVAWKHLGQQRVADHQEKGLPGHQSHAHFNNTINGHVFLISLFPFYPVGRLDRVLGSAFYWLWWPATRSDFGFGIADRYIMIQNVGLHAMMHHDDDDNW